MGCHIRVDPDEMTSTASVLQSIAAELSDVGGGVQSQCGNCCLPVGVEGQVLAGALAVESSLGGVASDLGGQAVDLSNRAAVAVNDSLPTAASAALGSGVEPGSIATGTTKVNVGSDIAPQYITVGAGQSLPDPGAGMVWSSGNSGGTGTDGGFFAGQGYPPGYWDAFMPGAVAPTSGGQGGAGSVTSLNNWLWAKASHTTIADLPIFHGGEGNLVW